MAPETKRVIVSVYIWWLIEKKGVIEQSFRYNKGKYIKSIPKESYSASLIVVIPSGFHTQSEEESVRGY